MEYPLNQLPANSHLVWYKEAWTMFVGLFLMLMALGAINNLQEWVCADSLDMRSVLEISILCREMTYSELYYYY